MTDPRVAPYGSWSSPVTPAMLASSSIRLGAASFDEGLVYWTETRPKEDGRVALVRADAFSSPAEVLPAATNVRTRVHEYGGGAFAVHRGTIYFSEFSDQRLYRHVPGSGEPVPITPETGGTHRFADGRVTSDGSTWIGVRERHAGERVPQDVTNELVAIRTDGSGEPRVIASGRDFYSDPRIAPDGASVCWLSWDLPWMPWDGCELHEAALAPDGSLGEPRTVAGRDGEESIWQPSWSPAGELYWVSDRSGWWNLERERAGIRETVCPRDAEFGWPHWIFGGSSYAFLGDGRIACHYGSGGVQHTALLDPSTGELVDLDIPHTAVSYPSLVAEGSQIAFIAGGPALPEQVVLLDFTSRAVDVLRESASTEVDPAVFSIPRQLEFPTDGGLHRLRPRLPAHESGVPGARGRAAAADRDQPRRSDVGIDALVLAPDAVLDQPRIRGGRRELRGQHGVRQSVPAAAERNVGILDTADCINAARHLAEQGAADGDRLLIRGGSAGGYTTLCALVFHDDFAAGASYYGLADLVPFVEGGTHKFECEYLYTLVGPYPEEAERYRARSPINSVDDLRTPMLVLQGAEDAVVPPAQAELIVEALERKRLPYAYLLFEGEQHGFRKADSIIRAHEGELSFYAQILGFGPGDPVPRLAIENLPA